MSKEITIVMSKREMEAIIQSLQITTGQYDFRNGTKAAYFEYQANLVMLERLQDCYRVYYTSEVI